MSAVNERSEEGNEGGQVPAEALLIALAAGALATSRPDGATPVEAAGFALPYAVSTLNHVSVGLPT